MTIGAALSGGNLAEVEIVLALASEGEPLFCSSLCTEMLIKVPFDMPVGVIRVTTRVIDDDSPAALQL